jgi:hypothetical protein
LPDGACNCDGDELDECGICAGSGAIYGEAEDCCASDVDSCGICYTDGDLDSEWNTSCADCAGVPNGNSIYDGCDVCLPETEVNDDLTSEDCSLDCAGVFAGTAEEDVCGVCDGTGYLEDPYGNGAQCCPSSGVADECGICGGSGLNETGCCGAFVQDECGICDGPGLNEFGCCGELVPNCAGECVLEGDAVVDWGEQCYEDSEGTFCEIEYADECGICYGSGVEEGYCDCYSNIINCDGECPTIYSGTPGIWIENPSYDNTDLSTDVDHDNKYRA